ncbi:MAG: ADP-ribosylglycohydrolase family protein [Methanolinea sp.]|nr:ADP-ribosylglycohydrolase family protein [Methanolinea sp.]
MRFISDLSRVTGVLLGIAIGDALGAPFEGGGPPDVPVRSYYAGGRVPRAAGEYTDDTLQALALAESLAACRGFCPADFVARLEREYALHREFFGPTTSAVLLLVQQGEDIRSAASRVHEERGSSRSNGSVVRGPPLGVYFPGPGLEAVSLACSALTHADPVPGACSAFVNRMVSEMCRGATREEAYFRALRRCRDPEVARVLGSWADFPPVPGLDALEATHAALSVFLRTRSFPDCVAAAVALGGDADSVAALAGALAGAHYGSRAVPAAWIAGLRGRERVIDAAYALWSALRT